MMKQDAYLGPQRYDCLINIHFSRLYLVLSLHLNYIAPSLSPILNLSLFKGIKIFKNT